MDLETIESLKLGGQGIDGSLHWSRSESRPRYCLNKDEVDARDHTHRFTCFDIAEKVESEHDILFAGRVSHP